MLSPKQFEFFAAPGWLTLVLLIADVAIYAFLVMKAGTSAISPRLLLQYGGLSSAALTAHENWRLITYGFLHATPLPFALNMIGLLFWGGLVERYQGVLQTLVIFAFALVAAGFVALQALPPNVVVVGPTGAIAGLGGAMLALALLGRVPMPLLFFVLTIALNAALGFTVPRAQWAGPLGGFGAGVICGVVLAVAGGISDRLLRCKFPEWVKLELVLLAVLAALALAEIGRINISLIDMSGLMLVVVLLLVAIKLVDLILSLKHGLAVTALLFVICYGLVAFAFKASALERIVNECASRATDSWLWGQQGLLCAHPQLAADAGIGLVVLIALLVHVVPLLRGLRDVGFAGASLQGERKRASGY
jgi:rhomboid protease GluP